MTAWLAITVAMVARITKGSRNHSGATMKKVFSIFWPASRISAPWPR